VGRKVFDVFVEYADGTKEKLEIHADEKTGKYKVMKPGLLGPSFVTALASLHHDDIKEAIASARGKAVNRVITR